MRRIWTVLFIAVSTFWAIRGGALYMQVHTEMSAPCEVEAVSEAEISEEIYTAAAGLEGVTAATGVWDMEKTAVIEEYTCALTVYGLDSSYLAGEWLAGNAFPDSSDMVYAVINRAAAQSFINQHESKLTVVTPENWLLKACHFDDDRSTPVRICGVIDDGASEARTYVSILQIRSLRMDLNLESPCKALWLRLKDVSFRESAVSQLSQLGLAAEYDGSDELGWNAAREKYSAHLSASAFMLLAAVVIYWYDEKERVGIPAAVRIRTAFRLLLTGIAAGAAVEIMW